MASVVGNWPIASTAGMAFRRAKDIGALGESADIIREDDLHVLDRAKLGMNTRNEFAKWSRKPTGL